MDIILNDNITITTPWCVAELFDSYASSVERVENLYLKEDGDQFVELNFVERKDKEFKQYIDMVNNSFKDTRNSLKDKGFRESYGGVFRKMSYNTNWHYFDGVYTQIVYGNLNQVNVCEDIFPSLQSLCLNKLGQMPENIDDFNNITTLKNIWNETKNFTTIPYDWNMYKDKEFENECIKQALNGKLDLFKCRLKLSRIVLDKSYNKFFVIWNLQSVIWKKNIAYDPLFK